MTSADETLGQFISSGDTMTLDCVDCGHAAPLDMAALAARFGPDLVIIGPARADLKLRCRICGSFKVSRTRSPPSGVDGRARGFR